MSIIFIQLSPSHIVGCFDDLCDVYIIINREMGFFHINNFSRSFYRRLIVLGVQLVVLGANNVYYYYYYFYNFIIIIIIISIAYCTK